MPDFYTFTEVSGRGTHSFRYDELKFVDMPVQDEPPPPKEHTSLEHIRQASQERRASRKRRVSTRADQRERGAAEVPEAPPEPRIPVADTPRPTLRERGRNVRHRVVTRSGNVYEEVMAPVFDTEAVSDAPEPPAHQADFLSEHTDHDDRSGDSSMDNIHFKIPAAPISASTVFQSMTVKERDVPADERVSAMGPQIVGLDEAIVDDMVSLEDDSTESQPELIEPEVIGPEIEKVEVITVMPHVESIVVQVDDAVDDVIAEVLDDVTVEEIPEIAEMITVEPAAVVETVEEAVETIVDTVVEEVLTPVEDELPTVEPDVVTNSPEVIINEPELTAADLLPPPTPLPAVKPTQRPKPTPQRTQQVEDIIGKLGEELSKRERQRGQGVPVGVNVPYVSNPPTQRLSHPERPQLPERPAPPPRPAPPHKPGRDQYPVRPAMPIKPEVPKPIIANKNSSKPLVPVKGIPIEPSRYPRKP
ncbi:hypothetical protein AGMMS49992_22890 [Clostridia bacterium]|nr:hypothetical protein AGMMS49992_22890 [Clostridia bacterium]